MANWLKIFQLLWMVEKLSLPESLCSQGIFTNNDASYIFHLIIQNCFSFHIIEEKLKKSSSYCSDSWMKNGLVTNQCCASSWTQSLSCYNLGLMRCLWKYFHLINWIVFIRMRSRRICLGAIMTSAEVGYEFLSLMILGILFRYESIAACKDNHDNFVWLYEN